MLTGRWTRGFCTTLLLCAAGAAPAPAASLGLQPSATVVEQGSLLEIVIYGVDFPLGTDGGDFSIGWADNLEFVSLTIDDPPWDLSSFDASNAALHYVDYVDVFSLFETPGVGGAAFDIATLILRATDVGDAFVFLDTNLVGWSLAGEPIDYSLEPETHLEVVAAPAPGAAAMLALALGLLGCARFRTRILSA